MVGCPRVGLGLVRRRAVVRDVIHEMPGELVGLFDQAGEVIAGDAVKNPSAVAANMDQAHHS